MDTIAFALKTKCQTDKIELEKNVPDLTDFVKKTKLSDLENKIWDVSSLAARTALTVVENKRSIVFFQLKKQIITQKLVSLKRNLLIIIMINVLLPQSLTPWVLLFLMQG